MLLIQLLTKPPPVAAQSIRLLVPRSCCLVLGPISASSVGVVNICSIDVLNPLGTLGLLLSVVLNNLCCERVEEHCGCNDNANGNDDGDPNREIVGHPRRVAGGSL